MRLFTCLRERFGLCMCKVYMALDPLTGNENLIGECDEPNFIVLCFRPLKSQMNMNCETTDKLSRALLLAISLTVPFS